MSDKPVIGLNADFRSKRDETPAFSYVYAGYYDTIAKAGGIPLVLPPVADEKDLNHVLDLLDGVVLVGGADLDPRNDGFMTHPSMRLLDERRETFDRLLVRLLAERKVPVYGVGAGMQLLNVARGGNLFFHIPEDVPRALPHKDNLDPNHCHTLDVVPGTLMERIYGEGEIRVNSYHHMAIDELAEDFKVSSRCPDGIIESIESARPDWYVLGTQFHPEAESASALDKRIFEEFVEGVAALHKKTAAPEVRLVA